MTGSSPLRVLFDVSQPAHVHLFKHAIAELDEAGHEIAVTSRKKGIITDLLDAYSIDHQPISRARASRFAILPEWALREYRLLTLAREFRPDVVVSHFSPSAVHAAHVAGARSLVFNNDETTIEAAGQITLPFATVIYTPRAFSTDLGPKHRRYDGYHELAYLHPDRFEPSTEILEANDIDPTDDFFVLQFDAWDTDQADGNSGFSPQARRDVVQFLDQHGDVYVSLDGTIPDELAATELPVPPEHIHHLLAAANLYAGDSPTMALEAGTLGTPSTLAVPADTPARGHLQHLEAEYSLVLAFEAESEAVVTIKNLAVDPKATERWADRREQLLADSIDVTAFMVDTIRKQGDKRQEPTSETESQKPTYELA